MVDGNEQQSQQEEVHDYFKKSDKDGCNLLTAGKNNTNVQKGTGTVIEEEDYSSMPSLEDIPLDELREEQGKCVKCIDQLIETQGKGPNIVPRLQKLQILYHKLHSTQRLWLKILKRRLGWTLRQPVIR